jgi:hypothetical protein
MNLNPIGAIIDAVGGVVGDLVTTDKERLTAEIEMAKVDASLLIGQMEVNKVEAASDSLWVAGWRPACGWVGAAAMAYQFLLYPLMVWLWTYLQSVGWIAATLQAPPMLDTDALWVILTGMLGIAGARTFEKVRGASGNRAGG